MQDVRQSWHRWRIRAELVAGMLLLLAACGRSTVPRTTASDAGEQTHHPTPAATPATVPDFKMAAYQGAAVLGGRETTFGRVFEHGKPIVLNFWAGLCPPCRAEMPAFQAVADEYANEVIVVGVDLGPFIGLGSEADATALLQELNIHYPAAAAVDPSPLQLYAVRGMPTTIFFAADGTIVEQYTGLLTEQQLRSRVADLVREES